MRVCFNQPTLDRIRLKSTYQFIESQIRRLITRGGSEDAKSGKRGKNERDCFVTFYLHFIFGSESVHNKTDENI